MESSSLELSPEEIRRLGYAVVDAVVERWSGLRDERPWVGAERGAVKALLDEPCPEDPTEIREVMERALRDILPTAGRIDHPRFFAFVPTSPAWPAVMGDWLVTAFTIFQGTWLGASAPAQVELTVLDWFREWLGMPEGASGLFTSGGSAANLMAVVAARDWKGAGERGVAYVGEQSHNSVVKALRIAGFPEDRIRRIPGEAGFAMRTDRIRAAIAADRAEGWVPVLVAANGGATNTGAVDPLPELADLAADEDLWLHVDAAYGGFAVLTDEGRTKLAGIERAHSVTLDPHKWLFQPYEAGCLMVRDPRDLNRAFTEGAEYLQDTELGSEHVNFSDRGLQLTRYFRAFKVWMTLQAFGRARVAAAVRGGILRAEAGEARIREAPELELLSEACLGIVCFRAVPQQEGVPAEVIDAWNQSIQTRVIEEGTAMMSSTRLGGRFALRLCPMNYRSTVEDVTATVDRIRELAREVPLPR